MEKTVIVNENDEIIGSKERGTLDRGDIYRVSSLIIMNDKNEILIAKRAMSKKQNPGLWGPAVAGTIEEGEDYYSNIIKESEEELGLSGIKPIIGPKSRIKAGHNYFNQRYFLRLNRSISEFKINRAEVSEIKWVAMDTLFKEIKENPGNFTPSVPHWEEPLRGFLSKL